MHPPFFGCNKMTAPIGSHEEHRGRQHPLAPPYPFPYKFLINQPEKCKNKKPFLVIFILVRCQDFESRHTIRETWGNESIYDVEVVKIFLVGLPHISSSQTQDLLEEESSTFGDIVQQDFIDTYYNLTLKTLMGMEWVTKFCPSASYALKVDSDMFLNVDYLIHNVLYPDLPVRTNYLTGALVKNSGAVRNKASKSYIPKEIYPNNTYPPYASGAGYVFSLDMAKKIYDVAQEIRVIPVEDAFMGICLYELHIPLSESPEDFWQPERVYHPSTSNTSLEFPPCPEWLRTPAGLCGTFFGMSLYPIPTEEMWMGIAEKFWSMCDFPNCLGAVDGKHIRIIKPSRTGSEYFNYKKYFSVVLMAIPDADCHFIAVDIGAFGRGNVLGLAERTKL
ncbi:unnamed protein product [Ranitomeya imitator]|uniref:Hexosyltransferase n=1 Tax=Ranitomeya imitator TaxID=111125 RepID=A0ABN9KRP6_9NEOB|nr:unnamed protein product [Ranitomeya imitator]